MSNTRLDVNENIVRAIKETALLLVNRPFIKSELVAALQTEMSVMEQGKMFYESRLAVQDLIDEGKLSVYEFTCGGSNIKKKLITPTDFKLTASL